MQIAGIQIRRRVFVGVGLAVAVTAAWFLWIRTRDKPGAVPVVANKPFIRLGSQTQSTGDKVLMERAEFFDPTPLFIPTDHNYGQRSLGEPSLPARVVGQPEEVFGNFDAILTVTETGLPSYGAESETTPESLPEVLVRGNAAPLAGFGRVDQDRMPLAQRAGYLEVKALKDGSMALNATLLGLNLPGADFRPTEFLIAVGTAGLIGAPVLTAGSGGDEVDAALRDYLVKTYHLGERLEPGRYLVSVGP